MNPADLQRMFQTQFLTEVNPLPYLFDIKNFFQRLLIKQIEINMQLKQKLRSCGNPQENQEPPDTPQSSQSNFSSDFDKSSQQSGKKKLRNKIRKNKNDTKNIPKNFGKAIITFIQQKQQVIKRILQGSEINYENFLVIMKNKKRNLHSIAQLRSLWLDQTFQYAKQMRKISIYFLKRVSLSYIFGSRICNYEGHIKYRKRFIDVLKSPKQFTYIKS